VPQASEKKKVFVDNQVLMDILNKLEGDSKRQAFRFVLSLVLTRKRFLRFDETKKVVVVEADGVDGAKKVEHWWVLTPKVNVMKGPMGKWDESRQIEIFDPQLNDEQITDVVEQMTEILDMSDD